MIELGYEITLHGTWTIPGRNIRPVVRELIIIIVWPIEYME